MPYDKINGVETPTVAHEEYRRSMDARRRKKAQSVSVQLGSVGNPDENASDDALAAEFQTLVNPAVTPPASFVAKNRDIMGAEIQKYKNTTALSSSPMLMRWLNSEGNARLAADDVGALANVEAGLGHVRNALKRGVVDRGAQVGSQIAADAMLYSADQYGKSFADRYAEARGENYGYGFFGKPLGTGTHLKPDGTVDIQSVKERGADPVGAFFDATVGTAVDWLNSGTGGTKQGDLAKAAEFQRMAAEAAKRAQETPVSPTAQRALNALHSEEPLTLGEAVSRTLDLAVSDPGALAAMVAEVGIESVGAMIPAAVATAATRNPAVGAATMGGTSYAVERNLAPVEFFTKKGYDLTSEEDVARMLANPELMKEAAELGHTRGLIVGALDWVSGGIAGKVLAKNPVADAALQSMVQGGLGGGGEGLAQYATEGEVNYGEVIVEALAEFSTAPIDVAGIGARKLGERKAAAQKAQATSEAIEQLNETATASKLRERSPEKFRDFVEQATQGGDMETMYIPAEAFNEYFQSQGLTAEEVAEVLPGVELDQIRRASVTGEDIAVPTATYMERVAGSEMDQFVVDNSKFSPQDMTRAEAVAFMQDVQLQEARVAAEQEAAREVRRANEDVTEELQNNIIEQLVEAGRPRMAAQQEAQLYPAFYKALAERMGTTVEAVVEQYQPPVVRGPEVSPLQDKKVDNVVRDLAGMRAWLKLDDGPAKEKDAAYFGAVAQAVRDAGLDPATATDEEVRAAVVTDTVDLNQSVIDQIQTPEFKAWAGNGVITEDGELFQSGGTPKVFYHGTRAEDITEFNVDNAAFFGDAKTAEMYSKNGTSLYPVYLRTDRTLYIEGEGRDYYDLAPVAGDVLEEAYDELGHDVVEGMVDVRRIETDDIVALAKKLGYDAVVFDDIVDPPLGKLAQGEPSQIVAVLNQNNIKSATDNSGAFDPNDGNIYAQNERGQIRIPKNGVASGQAVIDLFKTADLSTFLHESSHFFLSVLQDASTQENAPQAVRDMYDQARGWWRDNAAAVATESGNGVTEADVAAFLDTGTTGDATKDAAVDTGLQEQWARAFETYLLEGKAPTASLRAAFEQFRAWLMEVYRKVKGDLNVPVTDDIRQVFDMLLATEDQIKKAHVDNNGDMLAKTAAELGVTDEEYAQLAALHQEAQDQSAAKAIQEAMAPIRRMREAEYKERHAAIRAEVEAEVNARPVYRAVEWMGNKRWLGDEDANVPAGMRLDKEQLVERYGPGILRTLPRGSFRVYTPEGMDIDEAAGWFGFSSGDEMVKAMEAAPRREDVIANETDTRAMNELAKDEGVAQAASAATEAFHTDKRGDYIAAELRTLNKKVGGANSTSTASYARQVAKRTIGAMKARDAVASNRYLAAERRAAEQAQAAFAAGDRAKAADYKRQQLFNHMMFVESRRVAEEVGKTERLAKRLSSKGTRKNLAVDYLGAIDDVLEQYDFRKTGPGKENNRERMLAYVEMMKAQGRENEIAIPQHVLDNARAEPYMTLPVDRLRGVYATLRNIESTARRAQKLIDAKSERDMDQVVADIGDAFAANVKAKPPARVDTAGEKTRRGARQFFDLVLNADTLLREVDGFGDTEGAAYKNLKQGIDEATARLQVRRQEAAKDFEKLYSVYDVKERNQMAVAEFVPELNTSMAKWDLISIVLNMGNADNIQRLTDDRVKGAFTQQQLDAVLARMEKRDLDFVQSVWDYVDSFYAEIAARETRVTGVAPQKVEAQALNTQHGQYKGGYYPLKYDPRLSDRVAEETTEDVMNNMRAGRFGKAQTRNGHTKERAQSSGRAVLLDIGVLHSHINTVLHDLEMSEQVTNTWRILQEPRVKGMFLDAGKQVDHQALEMWVQDAASGQVNSADVLSKTARFLKSGFTVSKLAFNLSTVAVQITGVAQSMVVIGKKDFAKGAAQYVANPVQTSADVVAKSAFMAERETTFNKDIYDIMGDIKVGPKAGVYKRAMQNYIGPASFYLMQKVQFYAVDMPTWLGAYQKGLRDTGNDEKAAVQAADRAVARAQASGIFSDRSPIERGTLTPTVRQNDFVRMFTALGSYMFAKANVAYERTAKTDFRSPREVLSYTVDMVLLFTVEAILYNAIKGTLPGMGGDDDEEEWAEFLAKETALSVMSTMPFVRDLSSPLQGYSGGGSYGSITETLTKPFLQAAQGEVDKAFIKSMVDSGGMLLHLPASQVNRFIDAGWRASEGEEVAPIEYIMGKR